MVRTLQREYIPDRRYCSGETEREDALISLPDNLGNNVAKFVTYFP
jgi:hypothetical protein